MLISKNINDLNLMWELRLKNKNCFLMSKLSESERNGYRECLKDVLIELNHAIETDRQDNSLALMQIAEQKKLVNFLTEITSRRGRQSPKYNETFKLNE